MKAKLIKKDKDNMKKETLEEREPYWELVDRKAEQNNTIDLNAYANGVMDGAKWQAEKMYSEEEVGEILYNAFGEYGKHYGIMLDGTLINKLFEQLKNK